MYLSDKTSEALDVLVGAFFDLNRTTDRMVSILQNKFSMPQAADIIHHKIAHAFPLFADKISGFKDQCNVTTYYPETHGDNRDYTDLFRMMETLLKEASDVYSMIKMTAKISQENEDYIACSFLQEFMRTYTIMLGQIITLRDKSEQLAREFDTYDRHITSWDIKGIDW